jgi:PAT family beta-lactamase induction signal transducer AmpG
MSASKRVAHPGLWVPTSYLSEGIPFAMAIWVTGTMFKNLGLPDGPIALVTGSIGIAWSLKPLWAAFLDMYRTKKFFVLAMELVIAVILAAIALALKLPNYFTVITVLLWFLAFASATQDICVDGVYITSLKKAQQAGWQGTQSAFWNGGRLFGTAAIVGIAGLLIDHGLDRHTAWMYALLVSAAVMAGLAIYHYFFLPTGSASRRTKDAAEVTERFIETLRTMPTRRSIWQAPRNALGRGILRVLELLLLPPARVFAKLFLPFFLKRSPRFQETVAVFVDAIVTFFQKKSIWGMLLFVFLYRTGEGFLLVEAPLFMQGTLASGGLGLTLGQKSFIDGTLGTIVSVAGGLLGGVFAYKVGLKRGLLFLAICMNVPHLCYVALSQAVTPGQPLPMIVVYVLVSIEKFGYNFGFVGNMLYMMQQIAPGKYKMTHYAFATALMNLVLVPTQSVSGKLAEWLSYKTFFIFVLIASIPSIIAAWKAPFPDPVDVETDEEEEQDERAAHASPHPAAL